MANHPGRDQRQITITKHYNFTDYATQAYMALVALIVLVFHGGRQASWPWLLLAHGVGLLLVHVLIGLSVRYPTNRLLDLCRQLYPIPLYVGFYSEAGFLNQIFRSGYWDPHFMMAEHWIFGMQPGVELMRRFPFFNTPRPKRSALAWIISTQSCTAANHTIILAATLPSGLGCLFGLAADFKRACQQAKTGRKSPHQIRGKPNS